LKRKIKKSLYEICDGGARVINWIKRFFSKENEADEGYIIHEALPNFYPVGTKVYKFKRPVIYTVTDIHMDGHGIRYIDSGHLVYAPYLAFNAYETKDMYINKEELKKAFCKYVDEELE
jgi:hypothetical protein